MTNDRVREAAGSLMKRCEIPLTQGMVAIVDRDRFEELNKHKWHVMRSHIKNGKDIFYAARRLLVCEIDGPKKRKIQYMHRQVTEAPKGIIVDHKNHNGLDNRRSNLRLCTVAQNSVNFRKKAACSSKYKGVCWSKRENKWQVNIRIKGRSRTIGQYADEKDAALAYNKVAASCFGEFASLNILITQ